MTNSKTVEGFLLGLKILGNFKDLRPDAKNDPFRGSIESMGIPVLIH